MLRKKNKTIAGNATRLGCGSDITPAAVGKPEFSFDSTYSIQDEMRSAK